MATNYLDMSDEDFIKLPEATGEVVTEQVTTETPKAEEAPITEVVTPVIEESKAEDTPPVVTDPEKKPEELPVKTDEEILAEAEKAKEPKQSEDKTAEVKPEDQVVKTPEELAAEEAAKANATTEEKPVDYEAFYKQIVGPIKGGKKLVQIKSAEEAIKLMQMGAGFGRKMQEIQPHLKTLRFMENNGLLNVDQSELAFLVDLRNKNPDAIKKLVKEAGIDPLDFNNEEPVDYRSNIASVTDDEVNFREALSDIASQEGGIETISIIEKTWDVTSQEALMRSPKLVELFHEQRQAGLYDRIVEEMDRQKAFGNIPHNMPFVQAYQLVGDHLRDTNGFADLIEKHRQADQQKAVQPSPLVQPQVVTTKVIAPTPSASNNDKAKAAASTKSSPKPVKPLVNPLAMSDEEFSKQFANF